VNFGDDRFETDPTRIKTDWPGVIFQIEDAFRSGRTNALSEGMYKQLTERIEAERIVYRADIEKECQRTVQELRGHYGDDPKWRLIRADQRNLYRDAVRSRMRWLDVWEELLDLAVVRTLGDALEDRKREGSP
jgi:hypothetical protein